MPRVGLFIPCYIDQIYPDVGLATCDVLERFGCEVEFPKDQTCCGQPMANTGCTVDAIPVAKNSSSSSPATTTLFVLREAVWP